MLVDIFAYIFLGCALRNAKLFSDIIRKLSGEEALERAAKAKPGTIGAKKRNKGRSRK